MTCNQMMLLLSIYRGTERDELKIGTYKDDIKFLFRSRLIERSFVTEAGRIIHSAEGDRWSVTSKGDKLVEEILGKD